MNNTTNENEAQNLGGLADEPPRPAPETWRLPFHGFASRVDAQVELAKVLHRRHLIDQVEYKRLKTPDEFKYHPIDDSHSWVDRELELSEREIATSWAADGSNRCYWVQIAAEAIRFWLDDPRTLLPAPLRCLQCHGHGTVLVRPADVPSGTAKVTNQLTQETCRACNGTGLPPEREAETDQAKA